VPRGEIFPSEFAELMQYVFVEFFEMKEEEEEVWLAGFLGKR
jgi:hypothetical protein